MARRNICSNIEKCQCSWNLCPAVIQLLALSWKAHSITVIIVNWSRNLFIILTFRFHELLPLRGKADDFRYSILCCSTEIRYSHHTVCMQIFINKFKCSNMIEILQRCGIATTTLYICPHIIKHIFTMGISY